MEEHFLYIKELFEEEIEIIIIILIYTTNAVESINSCLRKVTRGKGMFINEDALIRVLYLRVIDLEKK